jgi:plastocyanin
VSDIPHSAPFRYLLLFSQSAREAGISTAAAPVMTLASYGEQKKAEAAPSPVISLVVSSSVSLGHASPSAVHAPAPVAEHQMPTHGSGSADWGNKEYTDCVSQCMATFGQKPAAYNAPTPTAVHSSGGVAGTGATHTVIVAPTQGVLRYIPFAVNASVGDTIKFMWGANNHTVTKSSALLPCNRSSDALFVSGTQNKDFICK